MTKKHALLLAFVNFEENDLDWEFETTSIIGHYRGTHLAYGMLCESIGSYN